jgi:O-antigen ligase
MDAPTHNFRFPVNNLAGAVLFAVVPLVFDPRMSDVFLLDKSYVALAALLFILAGWGGTAWGRVLKVPVFRWTVLFTFWMLVASLFTAIAPGEILSASIPLWLFAGALALGLAEGMGSRARIRFFIKVGSTLVALGALLQASGLDLGVRWTATFDGRVFSTFGNPNFLAGYLAAVLPLAVVDLLRAENRRSRLWAALYVGLLATAFVFSGVRGAFIGLGVGMGFVILHAAWSPEGRRLWTQSKKLWLGVLAALVLSVGVLMARQEGFSTFSFSGDTARYRIETWRVTLQMIRESPWAGVGLGNFKVRYPAYQWRTQNTESRIEATSPYTLTEHVHNEFLQEWAEGGVVGLGLFIGLWGSALVALFRRRVVAGVGWDFEAAGALGVLGSILGFSLSNFPLQLAPLAVLAGWAVSAVGGGESVRGAEGSVKLRWLPGCVLLVALVCFARDVAGSIAFRDTTGEAGLGNYEKAAQYADRLCPLRDQRYKALYEAGQAYSQAGSSYILKTSDAFDRAIQLDPSDPEIRLGRATVQYRVGKFEDALAEADQGLSIAPNLHGLQFVRGSSLFQMKRYPEAEEAFIRASQLLDNDYMTWLNLGVVQVLQGKKAEAAQSWSKALELRPRDIQATQYLESLKK